MYQEATDIRDVYLYKKLSVQVGSWYTGGGGGGRCSIDKNQSGVGLQQTTYVITNGKLRPLSDKNMKFCVVVAKMASWIYNKFAILG